jgi:ribosome maturation factor RimP
MSQSNHELEALMAPAVEALGLELLGIEYAPSSHRSVLRLYIDAEGRHVTLEDCESVSREVSALLDVDDPIQGNYVLEVSSPGFDRPLFKPSHFKRFLGQQAKIALSLPQDGRRRFSCVLRAVDSDAVLVEQEGREFRLAFGNISKARLVPDYSALGQAHSAGASDAEDVEEASIYDDPDVKTAPKRPGRGR